MVGCHATIIISPMLTTLCRLGCEWPPGLCMQYELAVYMIYTASAAYRDARGEGVAGKVLHLLLSVFAALDVADEVGTAEHDGQHYHQRILCDNLLMMVGFSTSRAYQSENG